MFADSIGHARHLTVSSDGTVYVNTWSGEYYGKDKPHAGGFLVALRDTTGDGRADVIARFGDSVQSGGHGGTGIALYKGALYAESNDKILRYALPPGSLAPTAAPEVIVDSLPLTGDHPMHPFAMDSSGGLLMSSGSASNACQLKNRVKGSPGHDPCTELETRGGIWRYEANQTGQHFSKNERYATGIRNAVGIGADAVGPGVLHATWPRPAGGELAQALHTGAGTELSVGGDAQDREGGGLRLAGVLLRLGAGEAGPGAGVRR